LPYPYYPYFDLKITEGRKKSINDDEKKKYGYVSASQTGMPLQCRFSVCGLDLIGRSSARDVKYGVIVDTHLVSRGGETMGSGFKI
jgi:hypothetical protein